MLQTTTKKITAPISTGEYTAVFSTMRDGKTPADTILSFTLLDCDNRNINVYLNNSRVCYTDDAGDKYTSEDFFFIGLKRQLEIYDDISPLEILNIVSEKAITLWVIAGEYTNVYSSKPKAYDSADLGIEM